MKKTLHALLIVCLIAGLLAGAALDAGAKKKKKKKKKKPKVKVCAPYAMPEHAAEGEVVKVTDAATEQAPIEITAATEPGLGMGRGDGGPGAAVSHFYQNIQVDSKAKKTGLYMRVEFADYQDYDLYLDRADGTTAAQAAGFGDAEQLQDGNTDDGHTELGAEQVTGIETADCGGYTADIVGATTHGTDITIKLWLGDVKYVPEAPAP
jgi:hypothetical protein